jgi:hypothetical protein
MQVTQVAITKQEELMTFMLSLAEGLTGNGCCLPPCLCFLMMIGV